MTVHQASNESFRMWNRRRDHPAQLMPISKYNPLYFADLDDLSRLKDSSFRTEIRRVNSLIIVRSTRLVTPDSALSMPCYMIVACDL